jgi:hypothetical protein
MVALRQVSGDGLSQPAGMPIEPLPVQQGQWQSEKFYGSILGDDKKPFAHIDR